MVAGDAAACTCAAAPARQRLDSADAAFVGRFVDTVPQGSGQAETGREVGYVFAVDNVVKGELGRRVVVMSPSDSAACGFEVRVDEAVGILLRRAGDTWTSGLCGQIAVGELVEASRQSDQFLVNWGGAVVGSLVVGLGALLLLRRLRRRNA